MWIRIRIMGGKSVRINADPDISLTVRGTDPGPDYPDSFGQRYGSGAGFFYNQAKILIVC